MARGKYFWELQIGDAPGADADVVFWIVDARFAILVDGLLAGEAFGSCLDGGSHFGQYGIVYRVACFLEKWPDAFGSIACHIPDRWKNN